MTTVLPTALDDKLLAAVGIVHFMAPELVSYDTSV